MNTGRPDPPRALIFDWDNTLVETWAVIHDALNTTLETFGKTPWTIDETRTRVRKSLRDTFPAMFGDKWRDAGEVFYRRYSEIHTVKLEETPGAEEMLEALYGKGFYMAVVSNKRGDYLRAEAEHLGWHRYFARLVGANDAARDKPAPEPVELALSGAGLKAGDGVWYIGDADIDLQLADAAGCCGVLLRETPPGEDEFVEHPPALHFADCMALCKFIDNL